MDTNAPERTIREFERHLRASGMKPGPAARHRDRLRFFLHAYLAEEWPRDLDRVDGRILRDYLGSWFINNVGGSKSDLMAQLDTFSRFYDYLYHAGGTSGPEHEDVLSVLARHDYFLACHDDHFALRGDPWSDFAALRSSAGAEMFSMLPRGRAPDSRLWVIAKNLERPPTPAVLDFSLFLDYLAARPIRLNTGGALPLVHLRRINQRFTVPEELKPRKPMAASRRAAWFFHMALALGMARVSDAGILDIVPGSDFFLDLDPEHKLAVIIDGAWNRLRWAALARPDDRRVSSWAQEHRDGFAALLADLAPEREWALDPDSGTDLNDALLARYILFHDVVQTHVLFMLHECGVLNYAAREHGTERVASVALSRFGRQVMRLFARSGRRDGQRRASPLQGLQQSLFSLGPAR